MQDLLQQVVSTLAGNPTLAAAIGASVVLVLFVWGVVSSSYRYR